MPAQALVPRFARDDNYMGPKRRVRLGRSAFGLLNREFRALEADAAVRTIAERLVDRASTAAERKSRLAGEIIGSSIRVDQFHRSLRSFYAKWAIGTDGDFHLSHVIGFLQPCSIVASQLIKMDVVAGDGLIAKNMY